MVGPWELEELAELALSYGGNDEESEEERAPEKEKDPEDEPEILT